MKLLLTVFSLLLTCMTFFGTAHADVIDPGNPYRKPHVPVKPVPAGSVYKMRAPDFILTKVEGKKDVFLLQATLPGPCEWEYDAYLDNGGTPKELGRGGIYKVPELEKASDSREIFLRLPEGKDKVSVLMDVQFTLYRFQETRFGPKVCGTDNRTLSLEYAYELETVDGKQVLKKL